MPDPTATKPVDKSIARGVLAEAHDDYIILAIPDSDYRIKLLINEPVTTPLSHRIAGAIHGQARRIDLIKSGGLFVEPIEGRPRRVQGRIVATDISNGTVTINAGPPIVLRTYKGQSPADFQVGQLVTTGVEPGSTFSPVI